MSTILGAVHAHTSAKHATPSVMTSEVLDPTPSAMMSEVRGGGSICTSFSNQRRPQALSLPKVSLSLFDMC